MTANYENQQSLQMAAVGRSSAGRLSAAPLPPCSVLRTTATEKKTPLATTHRCDDKTVLRTPERIEHRRFIALTPAEAFMTEGCSGGSCTHHGAPAQLAS
ncbi:unnamed protein product [Pleuronectes platessa]|uniref:Uncharacterized protein n=1 Tax=Pleuronectes platessa TaxID=8262 RepID=A0A9N7VXV9_PLEPL|nr:unnamed protein product [Pleuronectes platessa]